VNWKKKLRAGLSQSPLVPLSRESTKQDRLPRMAVYLVYILLHWGLENPFWYAKIESCAEREVGIYLVFSAR
jgi:hypothetical protein